MMVEIIFLETDAEDYYWKNFVKYSSAEEI